MNSDEDKIKAVEPPIDLNTVDETTLMFYLAGESPLPLSEFSAQCSQDEQHVGTTLNNRFQNQIKIDQTGFLTLTDAARSSILAEANPLLTEAKETHSRGKTLLGEDEYEAAVEQYQTAAKLYSVVHQRLSTVGDVPQNLSNHLDNVRSTHDKIQKKLTKDTLAHRKFLAEQRAEKAEEAVQAAKYQNAVELYEGAADAFTEARTAIEEYNECRLNSSSPSLNSSVIDDLIQDIEQKRDDAAEHISELTVKNQTQPETSDTPSEEQSSTEQTGQHSRGSNENGKTNHRDVTGNSPSREAVLRQIDRHRDKLTENPKLKTLLAETSWGQKDVLRPFESWEEALEAAGIDKKQALIDDLRQTATEVDGQPTTAVQNTHGQFSAGMFYDVFDSWDEALAAADIEHHNQRSEKKTKLKLNKKQKNRTQGTATDSDIDLSDFPTFDNLPPNKRFGNELAIKIEEQLYSGAGDKRNGSLKISDHSGETVQFEFWVKHDLDPPDSIDTWYAVKEVRLQQWESDGEKKRNLSSTRDTEYRRLDSHNIEGINKDRNEEDSRVSDVQSRTDKTETQQKTETSISAENDSSTSADEATAGADSGEGLLGSIEDEFDEDFI